MNILITEFMDERAVQQLREQHAVDYSPTLVDDSARLLTAAALADALVVRNRTQVARCWPLCSAAASSAAWASGSTTSTSKAAADAASRSSRPPAPTHAAWPNT